MLGERSPRAGSGHTRSSGASPGAERRQITVMFCDLVGSTALTQALDPEDVREVIARYRDTCCPIVERYGGYVSRFLGDGILVLFGYPVAHEDDAERAALAGLGIVDAMPGVSRALEWLQVSELAVRIGIATGLVIAGDRVGEGSPAEEEVVVGEAPNLAARLQSLAEPNTVAISDSTYRLLAGRLECADLGLHPLKGFAEPQRAWRVMRPSSVDSRFEAAHSSNLTALVDRVETMTRLSDCWTQARNRKGAVVLLQGEPGIGKSRLLHELRARAVSEPHFCLHYQCSPYYSNSALFPFIDHMSRSARFSPSDGPAARLEKLDKLLSRTVGSSSEVLQLLGSLLSLPLEKPDALVGLSAERVKQKTLDLLVSQFQALAVQRPVLMIFEDAHWIDPSSLDLLDRLARQVSPARIMLVLTSRPDFSPPWRDLPDAHVMTLERLEREFGEQLIARVAGEQGLAPELVEKIIERTDGNPLFVEELTKAVLGPGASSGGKPRVPSQGIPETLQDSLMARLDQMAGAKRLAQIAAVIGRQFSHTILEAYFRREAINDTAQLSRGLEQLMAANVLIPRENETEPGYQFKHALVRDAAYDSLLRRERERLHARLVAVLEEEFPETVKSRPELLAQHSGDARLAAKAIHYWLAAGRRAADRSENLEALSHLQRGLSEVPNIRDAAERDQLELMLRVALGGPLISSKGPGGRETEQNYTRALALCEVVPESEEHFKAHWGWWRVSLNHRIGRERAATLLALATRLGDQALRMQAHHCEWATLFHVGDHRECCKHAELGLALYDDERHRHLASVYGGHDARVCGHGELALSLWLQGLPNNAMQHLGECLSWANELRHAGSLAHARDYALLLGVYRQDAAGVRARAEQMIEFAAMEQLPDYLERARLLRGWAIAKLDDHRAGLGFMYAAMEQLKSLGTKEDLPMFLELIADLHANLGETAAGMECLQEAFAESEQTGIQFWLAELHRCRAGLLLARGHEHEAAASLLRALEISNQQGAVTFELAAATDLASLYQRQGQPEAARELLRPIYRRLDLGVDSPEVSRARALLGEKG
jgi:class 3 adenylate cyclase/predicted ATPase